MWDSPKSFGDLFKGISRMPNSLTRMADVVRGFSNRGQEIGLCFYSKEQKT